MNIEISNEQIEQMIKKAVKPGWLKWKTELIAEKERRSKNVK